MVSLDTAVPSSTKISRIIPSVCATTLMSLTNERIALYLSLPSCVASRAGTEAASLGAGSAGIKFVWVRAIGVGTTLSDWLRSIWTSFGKTSWWLLGALASSGPYCVGGLGAVSEELAAVSSGVRTSIFFDCQKYPPNETAMASNDKATSTFCFISVESKCVFFGVRGKTPLRPAGLEEHVGSNPLDHFVETYEGNTAFSTFHVSHDLSTRTPSDLQEGFVVRDAAQSDDCTVGGI